MMALPRAALVLGLTSLLHTTGTGQHRPGRRARLVMDPAVELQTAPEYIPSIADMSLSPWTYSESWEASRVPRRISQAQCLTSGCLSLQGGGEDAALEARPIKYQVLVLHRIPRQRQNQKGRKKMAKRYNLRLGTEVVTVGCTCVRPSLRAQR
ncbi:interleukin 17a/f3 [Aulostomus maculatus]